MNGQIRIHLGFSHERAVAERLRGPGWYVEPRGQSLFKDSVRAAIVAAARANRTGSSRVPRAGAGAKPRPPVRGVCTVTRRSPRETDLLRGAPSSGRGAVMISYPTLTIRGAPGRGGQEAP